MAEELYGKVALVTHSSQDIGRGIALQLARAADVMVTARGEATFNTVAAEIAVLGCTAAIRLRT
jgi:NAD(P)-dependent dehydrogenase (short-subunit alcohol dehydrogenase family)